MRVYLESIAILSVCYVVISYIHFIFSTSKVNTTSSTDLTQEKRSTIIYIIFFIIFIDIFWGIFFLFSKLFIVSQIMRNIYIFSQIGILLLLQLAKVRVYE